MITYTEFKINSLKTGETKLFMSFECENCNVNWAMGRDDTLKHQSFVTCPRCGICEEIEQD